MRRAPRLGPYRVLGRLAEGPDGSVYRAYDSTWMTKVLLVDTAGTEGASPGRVANRLAGLDPTLVVQAHPGDAQTWAALVHDQEQRAVELVGLTSVPQQNWFARAYGWPSYRPKTWSQVAFRSLVFVVAAWVLVSLFVWLR